MQKQARPHCLTFNQREGFIFKVKKAKNSETKRSHTDEYKKEEMATVGLRYHTDQDITENMIRREHGLPMRGGYGRAEY